MVDHSVTVSKNSVITALQLDHTFVFRPSEPGGRDLNAQNTSPFKDDTAYHEWDLSSVIPIGAVAMLLYISMKDDVPGSYILLNTNGTDSYRRLTIKTQVANVDYDNNVIVPLNPVKPSVYLLCNPKGANFSTLVFQILGWFI